MIYVFEAIAQSGVHSADLVARCAAKQRGHGALQHRTVPTAAGASPAFQPPAQEQAAQTRTTLRSMSTKVFFDDAHAMVKGLKCQFLWCHRRSDYRLRQAARWPHLAQRYASNPKGPSCNHYHAVTLRCRAIPQPHRCETSLQPNTYRAPEPRNESRRKGLAGASMYSFSSALGVQTVSPTTRCRTTLPYLCSPPTSRSCSCPHPIAIMPRLDSNCPWDQQLVDLMVHICPAAYLQNNRAFPVKGCAHSSLEISDGRRQMLKVLAR